MNIVISAEHLEADELQRLLDGEVDAADRDYAMAHLRTCASCAAEMKTLERQAALLSEWMQRAAFEERIEEASAVDEDSVSTTTRRRFSGPRALNNLLRQGWLRAAAVLVLLGAPVAVSSTIREWIAERIGARDVQPVTEVVADPEPAVNMQAAGAVRFAPAPGTFEVVFASLQQGGQLELVARDGSEAVLEITGVVGAGPVVSERGLRLNNENASAANYTLRVPTIVTRVTVRLPGRPPQNIEAMELRQGVQIPLSR